MNGTVRIHERTGFHVSVLLRVFISAILESSPLRFLLGIAFGVCASGQREIGAVPPSVDYLFPSGAQVGSTVSVEAGGKFPSWPVNVWSASSDLKFTAEEEKGRITIDVSAKAPVGPHLVRLYNEEGASSLRSFVVGRFTEIADEEPNDNALEAQPLSELPVTINGRLEKQGDTDSFALKLEAGRWLIASVDAYSLDSPVDPLLHLMDGKGTKLGFNHDGRSLDPFLAFRVEVSGTYVLQISAFAMPPKADIRLAGSSSCVYRLTVTDGPFANHAFPAGIRRGSVTPVHVSGWNFATESQSIVCRADASGCEPHAEHLAISVPEAQNQLKIDIGDLPEIRELEPNGENALSQPIELPCVVNGRISSPGDRDRFLFEAQKGEQIRFRAKSHSLGFPLDAVIVVYDASGNELARSDDSGKVPDPDFNWSAPKNGWFTLVINDLMGRGRSDYVYRLEIDHLAPDFSAEVLRNALAVEPGQTEEFKVNVTRLNVFDGGLAVIVDGLPDGISATAPSVPAKGGQVKVSIIAEEECKPANLPVRVLVISTDPQKPQARVVAAKLKGKVAAPGLLLVNESQNIWLTVLPRPSDSETTGDKDSGQKVQEN